jgi:hypothetical protein
MFKLLGLFKRPSRVARETDFGRRFGWFIEKNGERIGELDYVRWDSVAQFWHEYRLRWRGPEDAVIGPDAWISAKLVLRNRRYTDVVIDSFLTSLERESGIIAVRSAYVPEERLRRDAGWRWFMIVAATPAGGFGGFLFGYYLCLGILLLQGMENSHNDLFTDFAAGMLGVAVGALLLPLCVWFFTRRPRG